MSVVWGGIFYGEDVVGGVVGCPEADAGAYFELEPGYIWVELVVIGCYFEGEVIL